MFDRGVLGRIILVINFSSIIFYSKFMSNRTSPSINYTSTLVLLIWLGRISEKW